MSGIDLCCLAGVIFILMAYFFLRVEKIVRYWKEGGQE